MGVKIKMSQCKRCLCKKCVYNLQGAGAYCLQKKDWIIEAIKTCKPKVKISKLGDKVVEIESKI